MKFSFKTVTGRIAGLVTRRLWIMMIKDTKSERHYFGLSNEETFTIRARKKLKWPILLRWFSKEWEVLL